MYRRNSFVYQTRVMSFDIGPRQNTQFTNKKEEVLLNGITFNHNTAANFVSKDFLQLFSTDEMRNK